MSPVDFITYNFQQMGIPIQMGQPVDISKKEVLVKLAM